ncbi:hypothetical protein HMPREF9378_0467 [Streptococcus sanguinis SK1 = NCTC 7863]|jgi:hypothetical protein|uniref:TNT domain-containing protein n=1 Tax=Streptococcus sanguinis SK408 TaxID=888818 RepID=F2CCI6_STRSA|nr:TNT domain-containing protein [Streptococcus sanguinis]EGF08828.1 hypothetical protein HMPREF9378_0467 [Streptococcus sanguinis SK1 = NCTC 7863]EGF19766.1 hypothetical protein HMPREF9391_0486 [Streptococcus sanguinis SK408]EGF21535.1 hypothetical protein HMPREF9395_1062 [Streptococcus sanguinis SK1058]MBZ2075751.1 glycohydrolase toxin TNT-related protein [Streptococcus sanguinis]
MTDLGCSLIFVQDVMSSLSENIKTVVNIKDRNTGQLVMEEGILREIDFRLDHFPFSYAGRQVFGFGIGKYADHLKMKRTNAELDIDIPSGSKNSSVNLELSNGFNKGLKVDTDGLNLNSKVKTKVNAGSGVADVDLTLAKKSADLELPVKTNLTEAGTLNGIAGAKAADMDVPKVKQISGDSATTAVSGVKPGDVEAPKVNKEQILRNIEESRLARKSSNFDQYLAKEKFQKTLMGMEPMDRQRYLQWHKYAEAGIEPSNRVKLRNWSYPPEPEFYLKNKNVYDNPDYFNQLTGDTIYPGSPESSMGRVDGSIHKNGFLNGEYVEDIIEPGTVLDRYGDNDSGRYFSPSGASFGERALPPFMKNKPKITYIATKPIPNKKGLIAPWFDEPGMGIQHFTDMEVGYLMNNGYLKIIE